MKTKQYEHLLELLAAHPGEFVAMAKVEALMAKTGMVAQRLSTYVWEIANKAKGKVETQKDGRKVTGYKLVNAEKFTGFKAGVKPGTEPTKNLPKTGPQTTASVDAAVVTNMAKAAAAKKKAAKPAKKVAKPAAPKPAVKKVKAPTKPKSVVMAPTVPAKPADAPKSTKKVVAVGPKKDVPAANTAAPALPKTLDTPGVDPAFDEMPELPAFMDRTSGTVVSDQ